MRRNDLDVVLVEPDVEALILQRFRYKIRDEAVSFLFARDGVEALAALKANGNIGRQEALNRVGDSSA